MKRYILIWLSFLTISCSKDAGSTSIDCASLRQGLLDDDVAAVDASLGDLLNVKYTQENINQLGTSISQSCDMTIEYACFNCVQTLPPQSEIGLKFLDNHGDSIVKNLDLVAAPDSTIKLLAAH